MTPNSPCLELRPYSPGHLLALVEGDEAFYRSFGVRTAEGLHAFYVGGQVSPHWLAQLRDAREADVWKFGFAVLHRADGLVIGSAGFKGPPDPEGMVEAAYGIVPTFEGNGYATEALRELVSFAFNDPRVRVIRAHTLPANNASARVLEKNGFSNLGEVIDPEDGRVWRWERTKNVTH